MIRRADLAALNGTYEYTHDLPPPYGGGLSFNISYASGEKIYAAGNTISSKNWEAFERSFKRYMDELFVAAGCTEFAYPPEVFRIDDFRIEILQPVENGVLHRVISRMGRTVGDDRTLEDHVDDTDLTPYLCERIGLQHEDGAYEVISQRYIPWREEIAASLQEVVAGQDLQDESEGMLKNTEESAYNLYFKYESGRCVHCTAKGKMATPQEADLQNVFIAWADRIFDAHSDEIELD